MAETYVDSLTLARMVCGECGCVYAIPEKLRQTREEDGKSFYCPNGHCRAYCESEVQRLQRALDAKKRREEILEKQAAELREEKAAAERREKAAKGQVTRLKNRAANGVCPCCNRTFRDLQRHMKTKHPGFIEASE